jgi:iron(III) transport system permease protein
LVLTVGFGTFLIGTGAAWLVTIYEFPGRRFFEWAMILPLAAPAYVLAYAYTDFLQVSGPVQSLLRDLTGLGPRDYWFPQIRSLGGAITVFILALYPYVYLAGRAAFLQQSECVVEASRTLGCTPWAAFHRVALPLARPALAAGVALALMETLADFGAVSYFGVQSFTTGIYRAWFSFGDRVVAAQLASLLLGFVVLLLFLEKTSRRGARYYQTSQKMRSLNIQRLTGLRGWLAAFLCALPFFAGFLLPVLILLHLAYAGGDAQFGHRYLDLAKKSISLALITALLAVMLALLISYARRTDSTPLSRTTSAIAGIGYAIPGSIIAVGVLIPFAWMHFSATPSISPPASCSPDRLPP